MFLEIGFPMVLLVGNSLETEEAGVEERQSCNR